MLRLRLSNTGTTAANSDCIKLPGRLEFARNDNQLDAVDIKEASAARERNNNMRHIVAVHLEGSEHLEHIAKLRWYEAASPSSSDTGQLMGSTRQQMYNFIKGGGRGYALNQARTRYAMLQAVDGPRVQYVKTLPDQYKSDNLLSLPRY